MLNSCEYFHHCINKQVKCIIYNKSITDQKKKRSITQNTTLMSNRQIRQKKKNIFIIYNSEQKDILAAMDTIPFSSSSLNTSLNFWPFTHFHRGKNKTNFNSKQTASKLSDASSTLLSHDQVQKSQLKFIQICQSFQGQWLSYAVTLLLLPRRSNKLVF